MTGDVGPFSATCVAEFEGPGAYAPKALAVDQAVARRRQQSVIITAAARMELPEPIEPIEPIETLPADSARRLLADAHS